MLYTRYIALREWYFLNNGGGGGELVDLGGGGGRNIFGPLIIDVNSPTIVGFPTILGPKIDPRDFSRSIEKTF